jgi:hypothetical protein
MQSTNQRESVANEGLSKSLQLFPVRLSECKEAYLILQSQKVGSKKKDSEEAKSKEQKMKEGSNTEKLDCNYDDAIDAIDCCDSLTSNNSLNCDTNGDGNTSRLRTADD